MADIKNQYFEAELFRKRTYISLLIVIAMLALLAFGYFRLQVLMFDSYQQLANSNRIKLRPTLPARGLIYDRNGILLADNVSAYRLELIPEQVENIEKTLIDLGKIIELSADDLKRFHRAKNNSRNFLPIAVKLRLSEDEVAAFAVNRYRFPGLEVTPYLTRRYLYGDLFAHVIGYVARLD